MENSMLYAERIHLKRLKRKRTLAMRLKAYGSVFNHATIFGKKKQVVLPYVPKIEHGRRLSLIRRITNWFKHFFV